MDESGVKIWIEKVWRARLGGFANTQSLLVWDSFSAHLTDTVKQQLRENKTATAVIPGGADKPRPTSECLFKQAIQGSFTGKMDDLDDEWGKDIHTGCLAPSSISRNSLSMVKESWQELSKEMVERSFKKCGISNALDGTEDDLVWEEEEDSSQVEEELDCDVYDDRITPEQWQELFGESDDEEEFHGF